VQGNVAEYLLHTFAEAADLYEAGLDGVHETDADQKKDQNVV
jgi:hypothetical protein